MIADRTPEVIERALKRSAERSVAYTAAGDARSLTTERMVQDRLLDERAFLGGSK